MLKFLFPLIVLIFTIHLSNNKAINIMKDLFLQTRPTAIVTEKRNTAGDMIVYVNGQTAFNKEDRYNSSNWLTAMESAFQKSL